MTKTLKLLHTAMDKPANKGPNPPGKSQEELRQRLQDELRKKRPRGVRLFSCAVLIFFAALALAAWLLSPKGEPAHLVVVAFDCLGAAGKPVTLQGRLEALDAKDASLQGRNVVFLIGSEIRTGMEEPAEITAKSGSFGESSAAWAFPPDTKQTAFRLRLIGDRFRPGMEDRGHVVLVPSDAPLCLVQVENTLAQGESEMWVKESIADISPLPGSAHALQEAEKKGCHIVYLALAADRPTTYRKTRQWVRHWSADTSSPLPDGAVLSRFALPQSDQVARPWQKSAEIIKLSFPRATNGRRHVAIAGTMSAAEQLHAAGLRTLFIGGGEQAPRGVERLRNWEDARAVLEKLPEE